MVEETNLRLLADFQKETKNMFTWAFDFFSPIPKMLDLKFGVKMGQKFLNRVRPIWDSQKLMPMPLIKTDFSSITKSDFGS